MTNNSQIRYLHGRDEFADTRGMYSGFTLCYSRFTNGVVFGYAMCSKRDTYTKSIGREVALVRYHAACAEISKADYAFFDGDKNCIIYSREKLFGAFNVGYFKQDQLEIGMLSVDIIKQMDMFTLSHSYISRKLTNFVHNYAVSYKAFEKKYDRK